jgi:hypothetical protein
MLHPIDGDMPGGAWPAAVVIQSFQAYDVHRASTAPCGVVSATVKPVVGDYLRRAAQNGVQVVIRIAPSPGNFEDAVDPQQPHDLITTTAVIPGENYCYDPITGDSKWTAADYFRAIDDVAAEMGAIRAENARNGWLELGFEPANEPNKEWYSFETRPAIDNNGAWKAMNDYFVALYDYVHAEYPGVNIFTPPMAQTLFAEEENIEDTTDIPYCELMVVDEVGPIKLSGYWFMGDVYTTKNDGWSWHNYYWYGWEGGEECPNGQHLFPHFPVFMRGQLITTTLPKIISEVDLASPWSMKGENALTDKDVYPFVTSNSLRYFAQVEQDDSRGADYVAIWLLSNEFAEPASEENREINWHQAYSPTIGFRPWFNTWWQANEQWP